MNRTSRLGLVLPLVIIAITILSVAAVSGSFVERIDSRLADGARLHAVASVESELAAVATLDELAGSPPIHLRLGASTERRHPASEPTVSSRVRVTRLGETLFSVLAISVADAGRGVRARHGTQLLARIDAVDPPLAAAVASRDSPTIGTAVIDGRDESDAGGDCPPSAPDDLPTAPPPDSASLDSTRAVLRARATKRYPGSAALVDLRPVTLGDRCNQADERNWGDPSGGGACASYLPVVHAAGDLAVIGGVGQGVLIVDGDLEIGGGLEFAGLVVVAGEMSIVGGGARVTGGIIAARVDLSVGGGDAQVRRSTCRVRRSLLGAAPLVPVVERPWASVR